MEPETLLLILGAVLVATGILGGGFEVKEIKLPAIKLPTRIIAFIAGGAFLMIGFSLVTQRREVIAGSQTRPPSVPSYVASSQPTPQATGADEWVRATLKTAVLRASAAEAEFLTSGDANRLEGALEGKARATRIEIAQTLANRGLYADNNLVRQDYRTFQLNTDESVALVELTETWTGVYRDLKTDQCMGETPSHEVPQTVRLERRGREWIVTDLQIFGQGAPAIRPCSAR